MTIRKATIGDLGGIVKIALDCFPQDNKNADKSRIWHKSGLLSDNKKIKYWLAEDNGRIVGYIAWYLKGGFNSGVCELEQVGVHSSQQGKGVGTQLIKESFKAFKELVKSEYGVEIKMVEVTTSTENKAQKLYQKALGAEVEATVKNLFHGNDEVIMVARY